MAKSEPNWELYRAFLAVASEGSLSGAARTLRLSQPTLSRQIATLEAALDVVLFTRSSAGLAPTEAALALRPHAQAMAANAAALVRALSSSDGEAGVVRITASEVMGAAVIPPILADIRETHPRLQLELVLSNRNDDLLRREADIAVRMARPTQGALYGRRIGVAEVGLFASKAYVQKHGRPLTLEDRSGHTIVGYDHVPSYAGRVISDLAITRELFDIRSDNDLAQLAMIQAGAGIGACQLALAKRLDLVAVLPGMFGFPMETWIVTHEDLKAVRRVRIVFDALVEGLTIYLAEQGS
jgi:DNA-binding transcriptional LysR family regulator